MWQVSSQWSMIGTEVGLLTTVTYNVFVYPTMYSRVVQGVIRLTSTYLDPQLATLSHPVLHVGSYARAYRGGAGPHCPTCVRPFAVGSPLRSGLRALVRKVCTQLRGDDVGVE